MVFALPWGPIMSDQGSFGADAMVVMLGQGGPRATVGRFVAKFAKLHVGAGVLNTAYVDNSHRPYNLLVVSLGKL